MAEIKIVTHATYHKKDSKWSIIKSRYTYNEMSSVAKQDLIFNSVYENMFFDTKDEAFEFVKELNG